MATVLKIRQATAADIPSIIDLERASAAAAHWTEEQYQRLFPAGQDAAMRVVLVAESTSNAGLQGNTSLLGFLIARQVAAECELENIVVAQETRRNGVGRRLLDAFLAQAKATNSEAVFLEVRESNAAARCLYERAGFHPTSRRKSYYANPLEDAILYRHDLH